MNVCVIRGTMKKRVGSRNDGWSDKGVREFVKGVSAKAM